MKNRVLPLSSPPTAPLHLWRVLTLLLLGGLVAWDASGLDLSVMAGLGTAGGFPLRDQWWLETVLHNAVRQFALVAFVGLWVMVWRPVGVFRGYQRMERLEMVIGVTLALLTISGMKRFSLTSCPWDLQSFGGLATYVSHWHWGVKDGGSGGCFPGGHASSAFAFVALVLPGLSRGPGSAQHRRAMRLLVGVVLAGLVLGGVQTLRGAHYPSHTLWTGWICWVVVSLNHSLFVFARDKRADLINRNSSIENTENQPLDAVL
ncbi:MAG: phosphatase PAP2 family protein [Rhodoferax sp.]|nr:phosphatase PAP2 family protein [Rhodoferax sp.]